MRVVIQIDSDMLCFIAVFFLFVCSCIISSFVFYHDFNFDEFSGDKFLLLPQSVLLSLSPAEMCTFVCFAAWNFACLSLSNSYHMLSIRAEFYDGDLAQRP